MSAWQVVKTPTCRLEGTDYLNGGNADDCRSMLCDSAAVPERLCKCLR